MADWSHSINGYAQEKNPYLISSIRRSKELYKYLEPEDLHPADVAQERTPSSSSQNGPSVNLALTSFVQLAALQCNARKAMINVMDKDTVYSLAEIIRDPTYSESICESMTGEGIYSACGGVPLKGIPLTTPQGINIGSLAVIDLEARNGLTADEVRCLGEIATQVMTILEINRQAISGRRSQKLVEGLDTFVVGGCSLDEPFSAAPTAMDKQAVPASSQRSKADLKDGRALQPSKQASRENSRHHSPSVAPGAGTRLSRGGVPSDIPSGLSSFSDQQQDTSNEFDLTAATILARAANLIRQALGLLKDDGVIFLNVRNEPDKVEVVPAEPRREEWPTSNSKRPAPVNARTFKDQDSGSVLASSTSELPIAEYRYPESLETAARIDQDLLHELLNHYPSGHIWAFGDNGINLSSSSDDEINSRNTSRDSRTHARKLSRQSHEGIILRKAFPGARSILFYPVLGVALSQFPIAGFVFSCSDTRPFTNHTLTLMNSFCNTAKAECHRIAAVKSGRQKSDFVSTISHEMRSPLHGILASVEFLADTDLDGFQKSLVDTIDACGRTLLDTINHILDFSKISSFEKNWHATNRANSKVKQRQLSRGLNSASDLPRSAPQILQLTCVTDVSVILEEIVDGIAIGQTYASGLDITDMSRENRGRAARGPDTRNYAPSADNEEMNLIKLPVEITLNIEKDDWVFFTTSGSLRRVFMNIIGNAVKYTGQGDSIKIEMRLGEIEDCTDRSNLKMMLLTVTDTGVGISPEFLAGKLYVPFAQENALSPGTGLGLSIVRGIVTILGGSIDIQSRIGEGTTVRVALPLERPLPGSRSSINTPLSGVTTSENSIQSLRDKSPGLRVAIVGLDRREQTDPSPYSANVLAHYVRDWLGFQLVQPGDSEQANVIILEDSYLDSELEHLFGASGQRPSLIVLCSVTSHRRHLVLNKFRDQVDVLVVVPKPCGPYKLAKAFQTLLERASAFSSERLTTVSEQTTPFTPAPTTDSFVEELVDLDLGEAGNTDTATMVRANEHIVTSQLSKHAQMATSLDCTSQSARSEMEGESFPFPPQKAKPSLESRESIYSNSSLTSTHHEAETKPVAESAVKTPPAASPRVLLVDDNTINLRLLHAFIKKRGYDHIGLAEDGEQAVHAVMSASPPFEIIFMDISMPKMNGFQATMAIRAYEAEMSIGDGAMIIALTGLASARDQAEAFTVGCDIYIMKPVRFKEMGKLLDTWEARRRLYGNEEGFGQDTPHVGGPLTGAV